MPEGDTIFKAARRFREALLGKPVIRVGVPLHGAGAPASPVAVDARVTRIDTHGKHLWIHFDDGRALHVHLGINGGTRVLKGGTPWPRAARAVVEVDDAIVICLRAPVAELVDARRASRPHLGPDLLAPEPDIDEAVRRLAALDAATPIGVALLDQRVAAGVGNVFKSEVMFACRVDPFTAIGDLGDPVRRALIETAARMLAANTGPGRRTTVPGGYAVYGRTNRPCLRCRTPIRSRRQGEQARTTYWCPSCQGAIEA